MSTCVLSQAGILVKFSILCQLLVCSGHANIGQKHIRLHDLITYNLAVPKVKVTKYEVTHFCWRTKWSFQIGQHSWCMWSGTYWSKTCPAHAVHDYITAKTNWLFLATEWLPQLQAFNANRWFIHTLVVTVSRILVARWPRQLTLWYKLSLPTIFSAWLHATRVTVFIKWYIIYTNTLFAVNTQQWVSGNQGRQLMFTGRNWIAHSDIAPRASVISCVCAWTMVCIYCTLHLMGCILELCKVLCFPGW